MSDLINDDLLSALEVYYERVGGATILLFVGICFCVKKLRSGDVRSVLADSI